ncbi:MAG: hypothetical protein RLO17_14675 [Cyclobacteriaceae bacterium]
MSKPEKKRNPTKIPQEFQSIDDLIYHMELHVKNMRTLYERYESVTDWIHSEWYDANDILRAARDLKSKKGQQKLKL